MTEADRDRGERRPDQSSGRRRRRGARVAGFEAWPPRHQQAGGGDQERQRAKPTAQSWACSRKVRNSWEHERIGDQGGERAEIGGRIENVGVARLHVSAGREPALQQRRARRRATNGSPIEAANSAISQGAMTVVGGVAKPCAMAIGSVAAAAARTPR